MQQVTSFNKSEESERLEARISRELKSRLQKAAQLQGSTLSEFIKRSAEEAANEVIREYQILKLASEDSTAFVRAIFHAAKPNKKLKAAFSDYKKEVSSRR